MSRISCQEYHIICSAFGRQEGPVIPNTTFFFDSWQSISASAAIHEDLEARWEQNSLTQISSALHHQPTFLEADASDVGTQHELWEDCVKFFHEHILQIAQDQRVPVCWGDFTRYPYSLLVRTSRDAVTHWMWTIQYNHWWQSLL